MARKTSEELQELMKKENVSRLWSWSKINCFNTSPYEYYLKYVIHAKEDRQDCIYTTAGGLCHDIIEKFYTGQSKYEDMIKEFEDGWIVAHDVAELKFDRNDKEKNKKIGDKYYANLQHFFKHHNVLKNKPVIEKFIKIKIDEHLFQGYIDCCFKDDDGNYNIIDWKTSSQYKGDKAEKECGQLVLYAIGMNQMGVPMDKIRIAWNFLKYCTVQYEQRNGTVKTRDVDRCKIGESLKANARMWLKEFGYEDDADKYLKEFVETNNVDVLPSEIKEKYVIYDCYTYIDLTDKLINKWETHIKNTIKDICLREKDYEETGSEMTFWDSDKSVKEQSYYFATLCGYSANLHKPYQKYLSNLEMKKNETDLAYGTDEDNKENFSVKLTKNKSNEIDLSWLDDIM